MNQLNETTTGEIQMNSTTFNNMNNTINKVDLAIAKAQLVSFILATRKDSKAVI